MRDQRRETPVAPGSAPWRPAVPDIVLSRHLARLMDDLVTVPGTRIGLGFDALIGLIPGVGDLIGSSLSSVIVFDSIRNRVPVPVLARMGLNIIVDALLGLVPGVGDLLDVAHRANRKNLRLLEKSLVDNPNAGPPTFGYVLAAIALVVLPLILGVVLSLMAIWLLVRWALN